MKSPSGTTSNGIAGRISRVNMGLPARERVRRKDSTASGQELVPLGERWLPCSPPVNRRSMEASEHARVAWDVVRRPAGMRYFTRQGSTANSTFTSPAAFRTTWTRKGKDSVSPVVWLTRSYGVRVDW